MPKGIPLTEEELSRRREEISEIAVRLFIDQGFNETSMRAISQAVGMGKSTLYDYFPTKDDILVSYFAGEIKLLIEKANQIKNQYLNATEKLRQIMILHLQYLLANKNMYLKLSFETQRLGLESQREIQISRHAYQDLVGSVIEDGIAEGTFRPVDKAVAVRMLFAALTPVVFTSRPSGTAEEMMEEAIQIFLRGVQA